MAANENEKQICEEETIVEEKKEPKICMVKSILKYSDQIFTYPISITNLNLLD